MNKNTITIIFLLLLSAIYSIFVAIVLLPSNGELDQLLLTEIFNKLTYEYSNPPRFGVNYFLLPVVASLIGIFSAICIIVLKSNSRCKIITIVNVASYAILSSVGYFFGDGSIFILGNFFVSLFLIPFAKEKVPGLALPHI